MAAPSASNRKPWHFVVVKDRQTIDALAEAHPYGKMLFEAPLCIAVCGDIELSELSWVQDCSAATENLLLAATALSLGAVWLGVYPREDRVTSTTFCVKIQRDIQHMAVFPLPLFLPLYDIKATIQEFFPRIMRKRG